MIIFLLYIFIFALMGFYFYIEIKEPDSYIFLSYIAMIISITCLLNAIIMNKSLFDNK